MEARLDTLESQIGKGLPEMNECYEEIYELNTPHPYIRKVAQAVLRWLMIPLISVGDALATQDALELSNVKTTVDAMSLNLDGSRDGMITADFILEVCSNFVILEEETSSYRFAHLSVVEYLWGRKIIRDDTELLEYGPSEISAQAVISSISYLNKLARKDVGAELRMRPLLARSSGAQDWKNSTQEIPRLRPSLGTFAIFHWPIYYTAHLKFSLLQGGGNPEELTTMFNQLMLSEQPSEAFMAWIDDYRQIQRRSGVTIVPPSKWAEIAAMPQMLRGRAQLFNWKVFYVQQKPSRAFVAAAFGLAEVYNLIPDDEMFEKNDEGVRLSTVVSYGGFGSEEQWTRRPSRRAPTTSWLALPQYIGRWPNFG